MTSSFLDELLWTAELVEKNVSTRLIRKNTLIVRIIRTYFWVMTVVCFASIPVMVTIRSHEHLVLAGEVAAVAV